MTMDNTAYVALSHQMVLQRQMEVIAHNIANANTTGYKGDTTLFETFLMDSGAKKIAYVQDFGNFINFREGQIEHTGNQLDIAVQGQGFLVAETPQGRVYTRGGHLTISPEGMLATDQGHALLDERGQPIEVANPTLGNLLINGDGTVVINEGDEPIKLMIVDFDNPQMLRRRGAGYFYADTPGIERPPTNFKTVQGMLERSNVEPIIELAAMIETSRAYQHSNKLVETGHELQRKTADRMPQLRG